MTHSYFDTLVDYNPRFFDGEGGTGGGEAAPAASTPASDAKPENPRKARLAEARQAAQASISPAQPAQEQPKAEAKPAEPPAETPEARKAAFDKFIEQNKDLYDARTQQFIRQSIKQGKEAEEQLKSVSPILQKLAARHGVDPSDPKALEKALDEDNAYYEDKAVKLGMTVEQVRQAERMDLLEAENKALKSQREQEAQRQAEEAQRRQEMTLWVQQEAEAKKNYPNLDLLKELQNPDTGQDFLFALRSGKSVEKAYQYAHFDDILSGAMQHTAQVVTEKVTNDIRARGMRPTEGAAGGSPAALVKQDYSNLTRKQHAEINRQIARGVANPIIPPR